MSKIEITVDQADARAAAAAVEKRRQNEQVAQ